MGNNYRRTFNTESELIEWQEERGIEVILQSDKGDGIADNLVYDKLNDDYFIFRVTKIVDPDDNSRLGYLVDMQKRLPRKVLSAADSTYQQKVTNAAVNKPKHYIGIEGIEVEDVLRNFIPRYENPYVAHRIASAIEYLLRSPLKNGQQDIEKARYNLTQALDYINGDFNNYGNNK